MRLSSVKVCLFALPWISPALAGQARAQESPDRAVEERIVKYLREHVEPGTPLVVSDLYNNVFKAPEERKVLDRLFNTFFKIPLFIAQYKVSSGQAPSLADIARQFNFQVEGEAAVILSIIDNDPRIPKFIKRDSPMGEIVAVDVEAIKKDRRFGQLLDRTLSGWVGRPAPPFKLDLFAGGTLASGGLEGKTYLLYFWFSGCPPCVRIAPHLAELQRKFGDRNFSLVGVNADRLLELETTDEQRAAYTKKAGFTFPLGYLNKQMHQDYGSVSVYPTLFLVDAQGTVRKNYVNYQPLKTLMDDVAEVLAGGPPAREK